jgi:uncharacterized membrane protein YbhN (UPF0104 family)
LPAALLPACAPLAARARRLAARLLPRPLVSPAESFVDTLARLRRRPALLFLSLALAIAEQLLFAACCAALLLALGGSPLFARSFLYVTLVEVAPTPGGAGVAELAGLWLFGPALGAAELAAALVAWRLLATQVPIVLGALLLARSMRS